MAQNHFLWYDEEMDNINPFKNKDYSSGFNSLSDEVSNLRSELFRKQTEIRLLKTEIALLKSNQNTDEDMIKKQPKFLEEYLNQKKDDLIEDLMQLVDQFATNNVDLTFYQRVRIAYARSRQ
jgi:GTPase involved in cell partitioning and DNA repair